jgi:tRNA threonylcarbamoyladenosine biosynthesis protein TsaB
MIVLGFDTATAATSVALRLGDAATTEMRDDPAPGAHPGHATRLLGMSGELLASAGVRWSEVDRIAVGVGPGTFTGLRVGIATARGLAQSLTAELVGVSSLQALAAAALASERRQEGATPIEAVLAAIDARRGEVFAAAFRAGENGVPVALTDARALAPEELGSVIEQAEEEHGERASAWVALGDGAIRFRAQLEAAGIASPHDHSPLHLVSAASVSELGARAVPVANVEAIVPDYRRRPDAELALEATGTATEPER